MKRNLLVATLGALIAGAFSVSASAQTCASPLVWQPLAGGGSAPGTLTTCGGDTTATSYCAGNQSAVGPAMVFHSTFSASRTFTAITLSGGAAGFDPVMYMTAFANGCGTNAACGPSGDTGFPIGTADVTDGDWYIIVTAAGIDAANSCGAFGLSTNGTFPVTLQNFTVS
jgi:hypothetical protein